MGAVLHHDEKALVMMERAREIQSWSLDLRDEMGKEGFDGFHTANPLSCYF